MHANIQATHTHTLSHTSTHRHTHTLHTQAHALEVGLSLEQTRTLASVEAQSYMQDVHSLRATLLQARARLLMAASVPLHLRDRGLRVAYISGTGINVYYILN
jgi:hypothetical protein